MAGPRGRRVTGSKGSDRDAARTGINDRPSAAPPGYSLPRLRVAVAMASPSPASRRRRASASRCRGLGGTPTSAALGRDPHARPRRPAAARLEHRFPAPPLPGREPPAPGCGPTATRPRAAPGMTAASCGTWFAERIGREVLTFARSASPAPPPTPSCTWPCARSPDRRRPTAWRWSSPPSATPRRTGGSRSASATAARCSATSSAGSWPSRSRWRSPRPPSTPGRPAPQAPRLVELAVLVVANERPPSPASSSSARGSPGTGTPCRSRPRREPPQEYPP